MSDTEIKLAKALYRVAITTEENQQGYYFFCNCCYSRSSYFEDARDEGLEPIEHESGCEVLLADSVLNDAR